VFVNLCRTFVFAVSTPARRWALAKRLIPNRFKKFDGHYLRWNGWIHTRGGDAAQIKLTLRQRRWGRTVFSQHGEDLVLQRLLFRVLRLNPKGSFNYIDVGAFHPFDHSITAHLSLLGWRGIAVDFSRTTESAFALYRPNTVFILGAAGNGSIVDVLPKPSALGDAGLTSSTRPTLEGRGGQKSLRVSDLADSTGMRTIEFLNVDVEGAELEVLNGIDFHRHAPVLICVEIHGVLNLENLSREPVAQFLFSKGYVAVAATVINFFFLRQESLGRGS